jgi:hypothetical protein
MHDASTTSALPSPTSTLTAFIVGLGPEAEGPIFVEGEFLDTCDRTRRELAAIWHTLADCEAIDAMHRPPPQPSSRSRPSPSTGKIP